MRVSAASLSAVLVACALAGAPALQAQTVVQSFNAERDGHPNPIATLGFVSSPYFSTMRDAVAARFGGSVVFGTPTWPEGAPTITAEVLEEADIFVVTGTAVTLTDEEACLLQAFVDQGGAVLSVRNAWTNPPILGTELGTFGGNGRANVVDPASPIVSGPFGNVPPTVLTGGGTDFLPTGAGHPVLADGSRNMVVTLDEAQGLLGRAVLVGDEEIFLNGPTPFGASLRGGNAANQLLFVNIMAYLMDTPGPDADGFAALRACTDADGDGANGLDDCDDSKSSVHPEADEVLDGLDNDCDGEVDEDLDFDGDGVLNSMDRCEGTPTGTAVDSDGCEVVCQEQPGESESDQDGDGVPTEADCDDTDPAVHAGAPDLPGNSVDEDCSGTAMCDPNDEWRNHGHYVSCVSNAVEQLISAGQLSVDDGTRLVSEAARSGVGHRPPPAKSRRR